MSINYKPAQSKDKPLLIDITSSPDSVYIRRDLKEVFYEVDDEVRSRWEYQEAVLTLDEYENYKNTLTANEVNSVENSLAFEHFQEKMSTGVLYTNGHKYKPKYISDYKEIMSDIKDAVDLIKDCGGDPSDILSQKFAIYDETGTTENMVMMSGLEIINLYIFLYSKKEQYFAEYKHEKEINSNEE